MGRETLRQRKSIPSQTTDASSTTNSNTNTPKEHSSTPTTQPSLPKIDKSGLYDLHQVKRLLDDQVIAFMESQGYAEAVLVSNLKIILGTCAVISALYSHFNGGQFPGNYVLVFSCVAFYSVCVWSISLASLIWEASAMYVGQLTPRVIQVSKGNLAHKLWVHTSIGSKGSSDYKVEFRTAPRKSSAVQITRGYEHYFTEEGNLLLEKLRADLRKTLDQVVPPTKKSK